MLIITDNNGSLTDHAVTYQGISVRMCLNREREMITSWDCPAWVVPRANQWARNHGKTPSLCIYQGQWSILERSFERDIIPMTRSEGLALAPWGVVGQGRLMTDEEENRRKVTGE